MSIEKVNVDHKLAQIKAMGGDKNKIDSAQEQYQLSVFYNEVNLNPQKYSYEDKQKVKKCMDYTNSEVAETKMRNIIKEMKKNLDVPTQRVLDELEKLGVTKENIYNIIQSNNDETIEKLDEIIKLVKKRGKVLDKSEMQFLNNAIHNSLNKPCGCNVMIYL